MIALELLQFEQLLNLYDAELPGPWSAEKRRIHDEIARRVHAHGRITLGRIVFTPTDDGSFARTTPPVAAVVHPRTPLGRTAELSTPSTWRADGRRNVHRSGTENRDDRN